MERRILENQLAIMDALIMVAKQLVGDYEVIAKLADAQRATKQELAPPPPVPLQKTKYEPIELIEADRPE